MQARTHTALSFAAALAGIKFGLFNFLNLSLGHGFLIFVLIGTLLPDLDHKDSLIGRKFPIISRLTEFLFKHRGLYHSLLGLALTLIFSYFICKLLKILSFKIILLGLGFGFLIHLIGDSLTKSGVKWIPGFKFFHLKGPIKTGGFLEFFIFIVLIFLLGILILDLKFSLIRFM